MCLLCLVGHFCREKSLPVCPGMSFRFFQFNWRWYLRMDAKTAKVHWKKMAKRNEWITTEIRYHFRYSNCVHSPWSLWVVHHELCSFQFYWTDLYSMHWYFFVSANNFVVNFIFFFKQNTKCSYIHYKMRGWRTELFCFISQVEWHFKLVIISDNFP